MKLRNYLLCLYAAIAAAQVTITPTAPALAVGQSITLTAPSLVTWSVNSGGGTLSGANPSTSITYTAPASAPPLMSDLGCPVLPNDSVFTTPITALPVDSNSATWISNTGGTTGVGLSLIPSWGLTYANSSTGTVSIKPLYGDNTGAHPTYTVPFPGRNLLQRESGNYGSPRYTFNSDHHTVTVNVSTCQFNEYYNELIAMGGASEFSITEPCNPGGSGTDCNASSVIPPYYSNQLAVPSTSTDAAGLPLAALTWTASDILQSGGPTHATRFTLSSGSIGGSAGFIWPANNSNRNIAGMPPYGARFRLKTQANGGPSISAVCGTNAACANILNGLIVYGMVLADIGLNYQIEIASDATEDPKIRQGTSLIQSYNSGAGIKPSNFEVVCEAYVQIASGGCSSSLQEVTSNGYQLPNSYGSYAVDPGNGYGITPANYALVTATPTSGPATKLSIGIEGVSVGLPSPTMAIAAGISYTLPSWVTPSSGPQSVTWTISSGPGSIAGGNVYTAPPASSCTADPCAVLIATPAADTHVHIPLYVFVLAPEASSGANAGNYGIDINTQTGSMSPGKSWNADQSCEVSVPNYSLTRDLPDWQGGASPEYLQYESLLYTYGGDVRCRVVVPNGNYKVRIMQGFAWNGDAGYPYQAIGSFAQAFDYSPQSVDVNGVTESNFYDWNYAVGYQYGTPIDLYVPARVTNNMLSLGIHAIASDTALTAGTGIAPLYPGVFPHLVNQALPAPNGCGPGTAGGALSVDCGKGVTVSAVELIPDSTPPYWAIDTQGATTISPGQAIQCYVVDWYTGDSDVTSPTWSVTGPATISNGLVTLTSAAFNGLPIIVTATGASHAGSVTLATSGASKWAINPLPHFNHYSYRRTVVIDHTKVAAALTQFPILLSINDPSFASIANGGHVQSANGYDIIVTSDAAGTTKLNWEVESYNSATGIWVGHVAIPSLSATTDTTIYVFYGNPVVFSAQSTGSSVWDSNFKGVYHMTSLTSDSTSNTNTASLGGSSITATTGLIGGASHYGGYDVTAVPVGTAGGQVGTIEQWIYTTGPASNTPYSYGDQRDGGNLFKFFEMDSHLEVGFNIGSTSDLLTTSVLSSGFANGWHHCVFAWNFATPAQYAYVDGVQVAADTTTSLTPAVNTASYHIDGVPNYNSLGSVDEVRFSNIQRSAAYILTEYRSYGSPATFVSIGPETAN